MPWQLVVVLVLAFGASSLFSLVQYRAYQGVINRVAAEEHRPGVLLVTGRSKGRLRGAVVLLVGARDTLLVTRCLTMSGRSVFARFKERPDLTGPLEEVVAAESGTALQRALEDAADRFRRLAESASPAKRRADSAPGGAADSPSAERAGDAEPGARTASMAGPAEGIAPAARRARAASAVGPAEGVAPAARRDRVASAVGPAEGIAPAARRARASSPVERAEG